MKLVKRYILYTITILLIIVISGLVNINVYSYYELNEINNDVLDDNSKYELKYNKSHTNKCNDYGCYDISIKYFKMVYENGINNYYAVFVEVVSKPKNENNSYATSYYTTDKVIITSNIKENYINSSPRLFDYHSMNWNAKRKWTHNFNLNNLIGKKDLNNTLNIVSYIHSGTSTPDDKYQGNFIFKDSVNSKKIETIYYIQCPKSIDILKNNLYIRVDYKYIKQVFMFVKIYDTKSIYEKFDVELVNK